MDDEKTLPALLEPEHHDKAIAYVRALCPAASSLSDEAALACLAFVELGGDEERVSAVLGGDRQSLSRYIRSNAAKRVISALMRHIVGTKARVVSISTLMDIAADTGASTAARRAAAKNLVDIVTAHDAEDVKAGEGGDRSLSDMTVDELEDYVQGLKRDIDQRDKTIDGQAVEIISK